MSTGNSGDRKARIWACDICEEDDLSYEEAVAHEKTHERTCPHCKATLILKDEEWVAHLRKEQDFIARANRKALAKKIEIEAIIQAHRNAGSSGSGYCKSCGAPFSIGQKHCEYCKVTIS